MKKTADCFAVAAPGTEGVVLAEALALGLPTARRAPGGVAFSGGLREIYLANLHLRSAGRILVRVGEVRATDFAELYRKAVRLPWGSFLRPGTPLQVRTAAHRSRLNHGDRIAETVRAAVAQALGGAAEGGTGEPGATLLARFEEDRCLLSVDSSGELLHRRGYRTTSGPAPLRETLAAALLSLLGWDGSTPLFDPMCGSGTIPIEAALLAGRVPPGGGRSFAFMDWPGYRPGLWRVLLEEAQRSVRRPPAAIGGADVDGEVLAVARDNAERAGVAPDFVCAGIATLPPRPGGGLILCNPPYGVRLAAGGDARAIYRRLGEVCRTAFPDWRVAFLAPEEEQARATRLPVRRIATLSNGGIAVGLFATR